MTELIWNGKYDEKGNLKPIDRTILPFQVVETVNESKADREKAQRDLFTKQAHDAEWRNILIWGDNKVVMSSLLPRFAGKINLIYIDPPFATGQDFSFRVRVGDEEFVKEPSIIEQKAYRDTWGRGLDSYLQMMYERLSLMRELLSEDGTIYVHLGPNVSHYVKLVMDDVFGSRFFLNEVVWQRFSFHADAGRYGVVHDALLFYSKGDSYTWNPQYVSLKDSYILSHFRNVDEDGRRYKLADALAKGDGPPRRFGDRVLSPPPGTHWRWGQDTIDELMREGKIVFTSGGTPAYKMYLDEKKGAAVHDIWTDVYPINPQAVERLGFETQKPESLLERILRASSNECGLVADFFCGSGTTGAVAEKLGRRWIMCDLSKWAIQVTRKRLLQIGGCKPFEILNLGNYERHKLAANGLAGWERYVKFILDLYRAEPVSGFKMLHGKKARASVHVGSVDSPITMREIRETLKEAKESGIREVHFLGWDFEMGLHDLTKEIEEDFGVKPRLISIPKEALEVKDAAKEQIRFFDLNYLELAQDVKGKKLTVTIKDFIIANPEYIPDDVREKISKFSDYIDYWAVDWDYKDDTFHNGWQSFRTRKNPKLETKGTHEYDKKGAYKVLVKVVDIFGNDTTKMLEVSVK
jgi:adenine specific DNA methylase Mod